MTRNLIIIAALLGLTAVALGAFGAHGLESTLEENNRTDTYDTAAQYHMAHALALLALAWVHTQYDHRAIRWAAYALTAGTLIFSGSLYLLAVTDVGFLGAVAPIGGTLLVVGWGCVAWGVYQEA